MKKICAIQMNALSSINYKSDSSFMIGLEALRRDYRLFHFEPNMLTFSQGKLRAKGHFVHWQYAENYNEILEEETLNIDDVDYVFIRQDPPFDMAYITNTHLLEHTTAKVINDPKGVRNAPEKLSSLDFMDVMPATMITRCEDDIRAFAKEHRHIILKPLFGNGGVGIFKTSIDDVNLSSLIEFFMNTSPEPIIAQQFIAEVNEGDKRILLVGGEIKGAINRRPKQGEIRSNMHVGGIAEKVKLDDRDYMICAKLKDWLIDQGLVFCGIDVINGLLTEINVTSPTGIQESHRFDHTHIERDIFDFIEQ